jgi:hypothetical protein
LLIQAFFASSRFNRYYPILPRFATLQI